MTKKQTDTGIVSLNSKYLMYPIFVAFFLLSVIESKVLIKP